MCIRDRLRGRARNRTLLTLVPFVRERLSLHTSPFRARLPLCSAHALCRLDYTCAHWRQYICRGAWASRQRYRLCNLSLPSAYLSWMQCTQTTTECCVQSFVFPLSLPRWLQVRGSALAENLQIIIMVRSPECTEICSRFFGANTHSYGKTRQRRGAARRNSIASPTPSVCHEGATRYLSLIHI